MAGTAARGARAGQEADPDLVLLDLMLPDGSGFDVCRELRRTSEVPIVMLTARGDEADRIVGLEMGADDYVVEAVQRPRGDRAGPGRPAPDAGAGPRAEEASGPIEIGDVRARSASGARLALAGEEVELSRKEFDLLQRLMRDAGSRWSRASS